MRPSMNWLVKERLFVPNQVPRLCVIYELLELPSRDSVFSMFWKTSQGFQNALRDIKYRGHVLPPPRGGRRAGDLTPALGRERSSTGRIALATALRAVRNFRCLFRVFNFASGDLRYHDSSTDHIGEPSLAVGSMRHD